MADFPHQLLVFGEERVLVVPGRPASLLDSVPCHCSDAGYASRDHTGAAILSSVGCPARAKSHGIVGSHGVGCSCPFPLLQQLPSSLSSRGAGGTPWSHSLSLGKGYREAIPAHGLFGRSL